MKRLSILAVLFVLVVATSKALCAPVLISVELPTNESKKAWQLLKIPTYELIGNTAIAESEENQITLLKRKGFTINIIDRQSDLTRYSIVSKYDKVQLFEERPIWLSDMAAILKPTLKSVYFDRAYKHIIRPINTKPLVNRFWKQSFTTNMYSRSLPYDPIVQGLVDNVNADSITSFISRLVSFYTRRTLTDSCAVAGQWLHDKFTSWGYPAVFDTFMVPVSDTGYDRNVIGWSTGSYVPTREIIIGGHYDSYGGDDPNGIAPGADDNATGTAAVLEAARVCKGTVFESTIKFFGFGCEEYGMFGSAHYANTADSQKSDIGAVLNNDMLGWSSGGQLVCLTGGSNWLSNLLAVIASRYIPELTVVVGSPPLCDAQPFYQAGYPAIITIENSWENNPYIHSPNDSLGYLRPLLYTANIKAQVAAMAVLGRMPGPVNDIEIKDAGDGSRLFVHWSPRPELDVNGYKLLIGRQSGIYSDSIDVPDRLSICDTIESLMTDTTYYITIWAMDSVGYSSCYATEIIAVPKIEPLVPTGLRSAPVDSGIDITWFNNTEADIEGYTLYRKIGSGNCDSIYVGTDTSYLDKPLSGVYAYYYKIQAYDADGNHSLLSDSVYCRPITLDQGVLVVDETQNWTSTSFPRDAQQDSFYNYLMAGYKFEQYDFGSVASKPILADLGPYSTVLWHSDDPSGFLASNDTSALREYLNHGGKLWFTGWKPTGDVRNSATYPASFVAGDLLYDYFKISQAGLSGTTDSFKTAVGLKGYPDIAVDTLKFPVSSWGKVFRNIEALATAGTADTIYVMDMKNDGSAYEGKACAVRDSGKVVFFGFPLYYLNKDQARLAAQKVMQEFGEPYLGVEGKPEIGEPVTVVRLFQNNPNPFKSGTLISYQLPAKSRVKITVYNIAGQNVRTLFDGVISAGTHTVRWNGRDQDGTMAASGVYLYRLQTDGKGLVGKMTLLR